MVKLAIDSASLVEYYFLGCCYLAGYGYGSQQLLNYLTG